MSLLTGSELLERASRQRENITRLPILVLMAHNRCNCRCVMCDIWKTAETRQIVLDDLRPHLDSMRRLRVEWIVFSGGEPLMNPGLFEIARAVKDLGIRTTLLTTGLLLKRFAQQIASSIDEVIVSLDGPPTIHNEIRNVAAAFETMAEGVAALREVKPRLPVRARTTVQRKNFAYLSETVATARALSLDSISFLAADVTSTAFNRELVWPVERQSEVALTRAEIQELHCELERLQREHKADFFSGFIAESPAKLRRLAHHFSAHVGERESMAPECNAPWVSAVIEAGGAVRPCFFHPVIGSLHDGTLEDVINSDAALKFRDRLDIDNDPVCRRCVCSLNYRGEVHPTGEQL